MQGTTPGARRRGRPARPQAWMASSLRLSLLSLLTNTLPGPSASEVTTLWRYTNLFIIIFFDPGTQFPRNEKITLLLLLLLQNQTRTGLPVEEINVESTSTVWPILGSRTAK